MPLSKVVALVTGAGQGLGRVTAQHLASLNANVAFADLSPTSLQEATRGADRQRYLPIVMDVTNESKVKEGLGKIREVYGTLNLVVNCAGISYGMRTLPRKGLPHSLAAFERTLTVNALGTFNVARLAAELMVSCSPPDEDGIRGLIINTSSIAAYEGQVGQVAYAASKGAVAAMTLPLARDLASSGIRVNAIAPGYMHTPMVDAFPEKVRENMVASTLLPKRLGKPEEFAHLVEAIYRNPMLNGEVIRLDGGVRMPP